MTVPNLCGTLAPRASSGLDWLPTPEAARIGASVSPNAHSVNDVAAAAAMCRSPPQAK